MTQHRCRPGTICRLDSHTHRDRHATSLDLARGLGGALELSRFLQHKDFSGVSRQHGAEPTIRVSRRNSWQPRLPEGRRHRDYLDHRSCWNVGDYCYLQDLFAGGARAAKVFGQGSSNRSRSHVRAGASRIILAYQEDNVSRALFTHNRRLLWFHSVSQIVLTAEPFRRLDRCRPHL